MQPLISNIHRTTNVIAANNFKKWKDKLSFAMKKLHMKKQN